MHRGSHCHTWLRLNQDKCQGQRGEQIPDRTDNYPEISSEKDLVRPDQAENKCHPTQDTAWEKAELGMVLFYDILTSTVFESNFMWQKIA